MRAAALALVAACTSAAADRADPDRKFEYHDNAIWGR